MLLPTLMVKPEELYDALTKEGNRKKDAPEPRGPWDTTYEDELRALAETTEEVNRTLREESKRRPMTAKGFTREQLWNFLAEHGEHPKEVWQDFLDECERLHEKHMQDRRERWIEYQCRTMWYLENIKVLPDWMNDSTLLRTCIVAATGIAAACVVTGQTVAHHVPFTERRTQSVVLRTVPRTEVTGE